MKSGRRWGIAQERIIPATSNSVLSSANELPSIKEDESSIITPWNAAHDLSPSSRRQKLLKCCFFFPCRPSSLVVNTNLAKCNCLRSLIYAGNRNKFSIKVLILLCYATAAFHISLLTALVAGAGTRSDSQRLGCLTRQLLASSSLQYVD